MSMLVFVSVVILFTGLLVLVGGSVLKGFNYGIGVYKTSSYECGFTDMNLSINFYTMQFFFIGISFMLFDLEILLVLPILYLKSTGGSVVMCIFVIFLIFILAGTLYEIYGGFLSF
uniref:NADH-ubiquinone oxidoreductase chain 3 n=1 Tax=Ascidiella aspersa TaxID=201961 RepID=S0DF47_9ASCI|nr:NADH dehydrogenase subunit 3 [Ascidiella aspersa]CCO25810.1 NADH dehydrogenase subunit 3 [Ascidiella aspersa]